MEHLLIEWSNCSSWLAVGTREENQQGKVSFHLNTEAQVDTSPITLNAVPTSLRWHPTESILAIGWADGTVIVDSPLKEHDVTLMDSSESIFSVEWGLNGKTMCVVDQKCTALLYSYSHKKTLSLIKIATVSAEEVPLYIAHRILYDNPLSEVNDSGEEDLGADGKVTRKIGFYSEPQSIRRVPIGTAFLIGTDSNKIISIDDKGKLETIYQVDAGIRFVGFCASRSILLIFTEDLMLHQVTENEAKWKEKFKVKLGGKIDSYRLLLADSLLVMSYGENEIRVWDLEQEENGTLALQPSKGFEPDDVCICVAFSKKKGLISAGTLDHKVANWRRRQGDSIDTTWRLQSSNTVEGEIKSMAWSPVLGYLAVNTGKEIAIIQDENNITIYRNKVAAIQSGKTSFTLLNVLTAVNQELKLDFSPTGIYLAERQMCVWNKETIVTYDVQSSLATLQSFKFACEASDVVLFQQTLYCIEGEKIISRTTQGTVRQILSFPEMEGEPVLLSGSKHWLAVATSNGFLRVYDISKKEARQEYHSKYVVEAIEDFHKWHNIKLNVAGNRIAATYYENASSLSDRLIVWDAECDSIFHFSFDRGMTDQQEYEAEAEAATTKSARPVTAAARQIEKAQSRYRMMLHRPGPIFWDEFDSRYLVCEAVHTTPDVSDNMLLSMFVTSEHGLQLHDLQKKSAQCDALIGVAVPHMFFLKKSEYDDEEVRGEKSVGRLIVARSLREFAGLEDCDEQTRTAMLDFSLYLTLGRMDDAFKAIKFIKSDSVWEQMASMAVKTRRLDVAAVCLGHMKNVRGARSLRKAQQNGENEAMQCAAIALELGMFEEAEVLYSTEGRFDMVNRIEQAQNGWPQAFDIAARKDRIHLRNTHYNYAKYLEDMGQMDAAADNYERSDTHVFEVPRMFNQNDLTLEHYIRKKREPELNKWWARYLESIGEMEGATNFYQAAGDTLSVCRIMCMIGKTKDAAALALTSNDKSACYHMARTYEIEGNYEEAVNFYSKATTYSSAIRIAREHDMRDKLANLCLMAGESEMVEAARYYEDIPGYAHKAVMLYHKAGMIGRALDLAFRTEQFSALDLVAKDLDASCDENTLKRAAEFFENNQNYKKAVELLCMAKDFHGAITLCRRKNVPITDNLADLLTPTKESTPSVNERKEINISIGEMCIQQGSYTIAAKKLAQAGDMIKAMRALLRSGDTKKIRFFANTARNKEVYILAANYLQTTEWQGDAAVIKDIENFYTKSHSPEHLANFYISCAYMEIENWNDFDKAESALHQAMATLEKGLAKTPEQANLLSIKSKIESYLHQLARFSRIKGVYASDPTDAVRQLQTLAEEASEDDIIRPSHVFSLLISHHAGKENWNAAYRCITQLQKQQPNLDLSTVVNAEILDKICDEMRVPRVTGSVDKGAESDDGGEEVDFSHAMKRRQNEEPPF